VVVPTRDRPSALNRCLSALAAQTLLDEAEVLVVDDGSLSANAVSSVVDSHPHASLVRQAAGGPAAARNTGGRAARGAILCFTDDDCAPAADWIEELEKAVQGGADVAGGKTIASGGALSEASEFIARVPMSTTDDGTSLTFAPSNNLACRKAVFDAYPFDESYPTAAGEDREWCMRVVSSGYTLCFVPTARVVHHQQLTLRGFLRQQTRYGRGAFRFRRLGAAPRPLNSPSFYVALVGRAFRHSFTVGLLVSVAQGATAMGFIRGWASRHSGNGSRVTGHPARFVSDVDASRVPEERRRQRSGDE
jgi:GT2 family glycosyltransferase